jgi:transposase
MATSEEIRAAVGRLVRRGRGLAYPKALRDEIVEYSRARRSAGATLLVLEAETGVCWRTLSRWTAAGRRSKAFRRVEIAAPRVALVVHGPRGLRIEGLDLDGVADLLRRLG